MIQLTKCPHCQTTFRVTDDQLKLYDGAVRCGVCQQVFNGMDHLQKEPQKVETRPPLSSVKPKEEKKPVAAPASSTPPSKTAGAPAPETADISISLTDEAIRASSRESAALFDALEDELSAISMELEQVTGQLFDTGLEEPPLEHPESGSHETPSAHPVTIDEIVTGSSALPRTPARATTSRFGSLLLDPDHTAPSRNAVYSTAPMLDDVAGVAPAYAIEDDDMDTVVLSARGREKAHNLPHTASGGKREDSHHAAFFEVAEDDMDDVAEPGFVAQRKKQRRGGFFSGTFLGLTAVILLGILSVQGLYMLSDKIVAWWPPAEASVTKACEVLACPRRLETRISALSIESSELQTIPPLTDKYALTMLIRNSGSSYQSWPHIELTLTDPEKRPVVRRSFVPASYLQDAERIIRGIPPYSEQPVKLFLEMKAGTETDYRISLFHP